MFRYKIPAFLSLLLLFYTAGRSDSNKPVFTFGAVADVQYCACEPNGTRFFRSSIAKFEACVEQLNTMNLDFTIQLGDLIDRDYDSYESVLPIFQKLNMPKYHVLGNHEFSVSSDMKDQVLPKLGLLKGYYTFGLKGWRFIVLDGNDIHLKRAPKGSEQYKSAERMYKELNKQGLPNAQKWNGALGEAQLKWLKKTLEQASASDERVILFCHFPVYPHGMHSLWNDTEVLNIIESYDGVVAYINGHDHNGHYEEKNGIHHLNLKGMVETADSSSYAVIEVFSDHIKVTGYDREPDRILMFQK